MEFGFKSEDIISMFKIILDNLREGVNIVDENGILMYVNKTSAEYAKVSIEEMIGQHISKFYPKAALLDVLKYKKPQLDQKIDHHNEKKYIVNAFPLIINDKFVGGFATFRDVTEIEELIKKIEHLEMQVALNTIDDVFDNLIGKSGSLKNVIIKSQKAIGSLAGPRHSVITGESGTGKTYLANIMYHYAKKIGVLKEDASFIEVNCAQFTNPDIAAIEIFGSEKGAFTGSLEKKGLFELANGGMLFLDEAHALEHHQTILLKAIESGKIRRIGGRKEINVNVIIVAASTQDLKKVFIPELYQRLAQYELKLPPLRERPMKEREELLQFFAINYEKCVYNRYGISLRVNFSNEAKDILLNVNYPRNIRQFRDVVNASIDAAVPLINDIYDKRKLEVVVNAENIPIDIIEFKDAFRESSECNKNTTSSSIENEYLGIIDQLILSLNEKGYGPRKIAKILNNKGFDLKYYQIAYKLKKS